MVYIYLCAGTISLYRLGKVVGKVDGRLYVVDREDLTLFTLQPVGWLWLSLFSRENNQHVV